MARRDALAVKAVTRDMSAKQFSDACRRHGFKASGVLGYYDIGGVSVSVYNVGLNRRAQIAYLIEEKRREEKRRACLIGVANNA